MSKTITKKKSKQKEIDRDHLLEEELGEIKLKKKHINLGRDKGK